MLPGSRQELSFDTIGAKEIACQHRQLVAWLERLDEALVNKNHQQIDSLLDFLTGYVMAQFSVEDRVMAETGYQSRLHHQEVHERLTKEFLALKSHYEEKQTPACTRARFATWLGQLKAHVSVDDRMMAEHAELRRQPPSLDLLPEPSNAPQGIVLEVVSALTGRVIA